MGESGESIYRESALQRLSSPEQLDQSLRITSPKAWLSLLALWAILTAIIVWSVFGEVATREEGRGILVSGGGLRQVVAPASGRLEEIFVQVGDFVSAGRGGAEGDIVAKVGRYELVDQLNDERARLEEMLAQQVVLDEFDERESELQENLDRVETERLTQLIAFTGQRVERLRERRTVFEHLIAEHGMYSQVFIHDIEDEIEAGIDEINRARIEMDQLKARNRNATFQREREKRGRQLKIDEAQRRIAMLEGRIHRESTVRSTVTGRVVEIRAAIHSSLTIGDPIILVQPMGDAEPLVEADAASQALEAVLYFSAATGKVIKVGMDVQISPETVRREEYGSMRGVVSYVADVPTSRSAMMAVHSDADLVEDFARRAGGVPLEVRVAMIADPSTPSGYAWDSAQGPAMRIAAATMCEGFVTIRRQSPISLVIPLLKRRDDGD